MTDTKTAGEVTAKKNHGQCMVLVQCQKKPLLYAARERLGRAFLGIKNHVLYGSSGLYTFESKYTTEETLLPVLREIAPKILAEGGIIAAFSVFLSGMYTEEILFADGIEKFEVKDIREASEDEWWLIENIAQTAEKNNVAKDYVCKYDRKNHVDKNTDYIFGDPTVFHELTKKRFVELFSGSFNQKLNGGRWRPLPTAGITEDKGVRLEEPYTDGRGHIYFFDAISDTLNTCYMPFERFFFIGKDEIRLALRVGWTITCGEHVLKVGSPDETQEEKRLRKLRDFIVEKNIRDTTEECNEEFRKECRNGTLS